MGAPSGGYDGDGKSVVGSCWNFGTGGHLHELISKSFVLELVVGKFEGKSMGLVIEIS